MATSIYYLAKNTNASTEYRDISTQDHTWLLNQLTQYLVKMSTMTTDKSELARGIISAYWRKSQKTLPRGREGLNSPESMVAGILENMLYAQNPQKDFTAKQCKAIEDISVWMNAIDEARFTQIVFQVKVL